MIKASISLFLFVFVLNSHIKSMESENLIPIPLEYAKELLFSAAKEENHTKVFELINNYKIPVDIQDSTRSTSLHWAVDFSNIKTVQTLLQLHASTTIQDEEGNTPMHGASQDTVIKTIIQTLVEHENQLQLKTYSINMQNKYGYTPLHTAIKRKRSNCIKALLTHNQIKVNIKDNKQRTPLQLAQEKKLSQTIQQLIQDKTSKE